MLESIATFYQAPFKSANKHIMLYYNNVQLVP